MHYLLIKDNNGNIIDRMPTQYSNNGENLEKEYTTDYIKQHNGELPWWYEGSMADRAVEFPEVKIVGNSRKKK